MKHTTHYRITINHIDKIITLDKPLSQSPFFQEPRKYCEKEDARTHALIHYSKCREQHYFRNYQYALNFFKECQESVFLKSYLFNNVF